MHDHSFCFLLFALTCALHPASSFAFNSKAIVAVHIILHEQLAMTNRNGERTATTQPSRLVHSAELRRIITS